MGEGGVGGRRGSVMSASIFETPPLLPGAGEAHTRAILGAMRAVAETGGPASASDRRALAPEDPDQSGGRRGGRRAGPG